MKECQEKQIKLNAKQLVATFASFQTFQHFPKKENWKKPHVLVKNKALEKSLRIDDFLLCIFLLLFIIIIGTKK